MLKQSFSGNLIEAGCDEAGRGCLAGPVFAASVILPHDYKCDLINDSKKLNEKQRFELRDIIQRDALAWAIATADNTEIDQINILNASILSMQRAVEKLQLIPQLLLIDGNRFKKFKEIPHQCVIKGDAIFMSIAAASILAKTYRDDFMHKIHLENPNYSWNKNKGYPTLEHKRAIKKFGVTKYHRLTFNMTEQTKLDL
ncbi:MAG: ribonuclease HII [Bacteroidetes bacterium]|nr:ribonuclease HII [Bacteroidota bacterium]